MSDPRPAGLRLFLAYAPGAGKTRRLLEEALAAHARGLDVVVAWAQPRGQPELQTLLAGLERLPPRRVAAFGLEVEELDLEGLLRRRPQWAVIDDLAHANPPGARHRRRYEDVTEALEAGIGVWSALEVAQLASLADVVRRAVGFEARERVPDVVVQRATDVVALDLPVSEYLARGPGRSGEAARALWREPEKLRALRELMLREAAEHVRRQPPVPARQPAALAGRVAVALSSLSPQAGALLRQGSRFAGRLNTAWFAIYVETPAEAPGRISAEAERTLLQHAETARELGAEFVRLKAADPVSALIDFGRAHGVTHLVIGRSQGGWRWPWRRAPGTPWWALGGGFDTRLLRQARDFAVYVAAQDGPP